MELIYEGIGFVAFWVTIIGLIAYGFMYLNYRLLGGLRKGFVEQCLEIIGWIFTLRKIIKKYGGYPMKFHYWSIRWSKRWEEEDGMRSAWGCWVMVKIDSYFATKNYNKTIDIDK